MNKAIRESFECCLISFASTPLGHFVQERGLLILYLSLTTYFVILAR